MYISLQGLVAGAKKLCGDIVRVKAQRNRFPFPDSAVSLSELKLSVITLLFLTLQCHCRSQAQRNRTPFPDSAVTMTLLIKKSRNIIPLNIFKKNVFQSLVHQEALLNFVANFPKMVKMVKMVKMAK